MSAANPIPFPHERRRPGASGPSGRDRPTVSPFTDGNVDETPIAFAQRRLGVVILLLLVSVAEGIALGASWNLVLRSGFLGFVMAVPVCLINILLMWNAGAKYRVWIVDQRASAVTMSKILIGAWVALVVSMGIIRVIAPMLAGRAATAEGTATAGPPIWLDIIQALLLSVIMVAVGALAFYDGYSLGDPIAKRQRQIADEIAQLDRHLPHLQGRVHEMELLLQRAERELGAVPFHATVALEASAGLADELAAYGRFLMYTHTGDPAASGMTIPPVPGFRTLQPPMANPAIPLTPPQPDVEEQPHHDQNEDNDDDA